MRLLRYARNDNQKKYKKSFTLVELMIVIAILAILSAIVIFALNPARLFDNFRDSKRVTDIQSINKAIVFMESWNQSGITYGTTTNVYISLPDSNPSCTSYTLPTLPAGFAYYCKPTSTYKNTDGTGWIPINFTVEGSNKYLSNLPIDPVNNSSFFYTYYSGGSYEVTALLKNPNTNSINDDDSLTGAFTLGSPNRSWTNPLSRDTNLVGHWKFNEGTGTTAYDSSGYGRNGAISNGTWSSLSNINILNFNGNNTYVSPGNVTNLNEITQFSFSFWWKQSVVNAWDYIFSCGSGGDGIGLSTSTNGRIYGSVNISGGNTNHCTGMYANYINPNTWYYIVMDYNGERSGQTKIYLYINGVKSLDFGWNGGTSTPAKTGSLTGTNLLIGRAEISLEGAVSDFRIYNRLLSLNEMRSIYNQTKSKYQ